MSVRNCPACGSSARAHSVQVAEDAVECWVECDRCETRGEAVEDAYADWATAEDIWNSGSLQS